MSQPTHENNAPGTSRSLTAFAIAQLLLVGVAAAGLTYRHNQLNESAALPPLREVPLEIAPELSIIDANVISEEQLRTALLKLRPVLNEDTGVARVDHNLRFWGHQATFTDPQFCSGAEMRDSLLDHTVFRRVYTPEEADAKPLLIDVDETGGIRVRDFEGPLSSSHDDHTMACLAEVGTPLDYPVLTINRPALFRNIVEQSLRDFSLNQVEYEWSTLTYALFVKDTNRWMTSEGQEVSFDMLAHRIMRQEMPQGVCFGNHRLHTLVMLLRVDDVWDGPTPMLSRDVREEIIAYLGLMTQKLIDHQHEGGFWNSDWATAKPGSAQPTDADGDALSDRVIATGHALEWWALAPEKDRYRIVPADITVVRKAAQWLVRTINEMSIEDTRRNSAFLSHAGRALALWRGKFPHEVVLNEPRAEGANDQ